jgi:RNA polymerase sigma-70 factor (ECF subfamily)
MDCPDAPPIDALDDADLMARVVTRDQSAFRLLAERHASRIIAMAQRILGSAAEADEVAQETLFRVWQHAGRWDPSRAPASAWMHRIAYNLCIDRARRRIFQPLDTAHDVADPMPSQMESLEMREEIRRLAAAMALLPTRQRAAITLFYQQDMSGAEAAATMGVSEQGLWSLLFRGRRALARALGAYT